MEWGRVRGRQRERGMGERQKCLPAWPSRIKTRVSRLQLLAGPAEPTDNFNKHLGTLFGSIGWLGGDHPPPPSPKSLPIRRPPPHAPPRLG